MTSTLLTLLALASAAQAGTVMHRRDTSITTSQRIADTNARLGQLGQKTTIASGVQYWLSGYSTHNIYGSLDNAGSLIISQTDSAVKYPGGQSVYFTSGGLSNRGSILLNDVSAISAPTYNWQLDTFTNDGTIQWCGRGDTGGSTYLLQCNSATCTNNGLVVFEQVNDNYGAAAKWQSLSGTPSNNGGFLMREARVDFAQAYQGTGCWMIDEDATMYLKDGVGAFSGQSISFVSTRGILHMDAAVTVKSSAFSAQVYGFGSDNAIEFSQIIASYSYANSILTVRFTTGSSVQINIGSGYDSTKFTRKSQVNKYGTYNAIVYSGTAARPSTAAPSQCQQTASKCSALPSTGFPGGGQTSTSSTSTATSTAATSTASTSAATTSTAAPTTAITSTAAPSTATTSTAASSTATTSTAGTSTAAPTTATTSTAAPTTTTSSSVPTSTFAYGGQTLGCFRDNAGFGGDRSLPSARISETGMTNEYCANHCGQLGYKYSGTEYGQECYCGAVAPTTASQDCTVACAGNSTQVCGGGWALSVFDNTAIKGSVVDSSYTALGCYLDSVSSRTLQGYSFASDNMTQSVCATQCSSRGFAFSGTEYGRECYCASYAPQVTSTSCTMTCAASNAELCGGPNALTVLQDSRITAADAPSCPSLPAGYTVCKEGQRVVSGKCVS